MNTHMSFSIAKLLKEKGFNIPVMNYYLLKEKGKFLHEGFDDEWWSSSLIDYSGCLYTTKELFQEFLKTKQ